MKNAEIQIQFPTPGKWGEFTLTAVYEDAAGYVRTDRYTQDEIPADQAPGHAGSSSRAGGAGRTMASGAGMGAVEIRVA